MGEPGMVRAAVVAIGFLAAGGFAEGEEPPRDINDPSVTKRPMADASKIALIVLDYPSQAVRKKLEGRVKLIMCVNAAGKPNSVSVVESSGHPVLDEAARKWFSRKARLKPAEATGTPVEVCNYTFEWT
jgi:TonB family protein